MNENEDNLEITINSISKTRFTINPNTKIKIKFIPKVLSFFITNIDKIPKLILARQFESITKRKLFEYCTYFASNISLPQNLTKNTFNIKNGGEGGRDLSFIYQSLNSSTYCVLISSSNYNIIEGLDIIKCIHRLITDLCSDIDRDNNLNLINTIKNKGYEIMHAVDDIINSYSGKQETNLSNVKSQLKMDSLNEKEHTLVQKSKEDRARENIIRGMKEIEELKRLNLYKDNSISSESINEKSIMVSSSKDSKIVSSLNLREKLIEKLMERRREEDMRMSNFLNF